VLNVVNKYVYFYLINDFVKEEKFNLRGKIFEFWGFLYLVLSYENYMGFTKNQFKFNNQVGFDSLNWI